MLQRLCGIEQVMARRLRDAGWRISSVPTPQRGGHPSERGHRCPSCQIRIPARRRPARVDGRSVRSTPPLERQTLRTRGRQPVVAPAPTAQICQAQSLPQRVHRKSTGLGARVSVEMCDTWNAERAVDMYRFDPCLVYISFSSPRGRLTVCGAGPQHPGRWCSVA
jgi:hypothetical protein